MMNAEIILNHHGLRREARTATRPAVAPVQMAELSDEIAMERLEARFADLTWKAVAPITALSLTFAVGILACAQFFVLHS